jgi:hypothetical protein
MDGNLVTLSKKSPGRHTFLQRKEFPIIGSVARLGRGQLPAVIGNDTIPVALSLRKDHSNRKFRRIAMESELVDPFFQRC